jgi:proteasome lid subunit RPN8/RPN11
MTPEVSGLSRFRGISHEQCGLIIRAKDGSLSVVRVHNASKNPEAYEINEVSIMSVRDSLASGQSIVGILHTHLEHHPLEPSPRDWDGAAQNPGWLHAIYKPSTGELMWYQYEAD